MTNNPFLSAYEFEKRFHLPRLRLTIEKAESAYKTLEPETIDWCKSIIESMCKQVMREKDPDYVDDEKTELPKLIKAALEKSGIGNDQIRGGITSLVNAIAQIRNDNTVAGHGLMGTKPLIGKTEIQLFVSTFEHLTQIFLILIQREDPDIRHTTMAFKELESLLNLEDFNRETDASVSVEYDKEEGTLFIEGKEIRPSEILYHFDRESYASKIKSAKDALNERTLERVESLISDHLMEDWFDEYNPDHFEYDDPEVYIDSFTVDMRNGKVTAHGSVTTHVTVDISADEYQTAGGTNKIIAHCYWLIEEGEDTPLDLECLELDRIEWIDQNEDTDDTSNPGQGSEPSAPPECP
ncbi:MAG: hypothetical protein HQM06_16810 [Magnetococcales bacterium]|nr:hypothetical protein [Magnetococcales bacterium]